MMKTSPKKPNRTLNASARRAAPGMADDYEEEPSMKLTSALVVVFLLHLVALGGVFAFNSIKARRSSDIEAARASEPMSAAVQEQKNSASTVGNVYEVRPGDTLIRIANSYGVEVEAIERANGLRNVEVLRVGQEIRIPDATTASEAKLPERSGEPKTNHGERVASAPTSPSAVADSGETYKVAKGDNPVAIARHLKVKYSDLIDLNKIEDPRLLQIGQILKIPAKRD